MDLSDEELLSWWNSQNKVTRVALPVVLSCGMAFISVLIFLAFKALWSVWQ